MVGGAPSAQQEAGDVHVPALRASAARNERARADRPRKRRRAAAARAHRMRAGRTEERHLQNLRRLARNPAPAPLSPAAISSPLMSNGFRQHLRRAIELAQQARDRGNHPFGALLVDGRGNVALEAENTVHTDNDVTAHAETNLMRAASARFAPEFLERCTLYTSTEPCAMCAGAIYWGNVRHVVFGLSQEQIQSISNGNPDNMQLAISSREIFERGDHPVEVSGPHLPRESSAVHDGFWD